MKSLARQHRRSVVPFRLTGWSPALQVYVQRTIGYRARCSCGWGGRPQESIAEARADHEGHLHDVKQRTV